MLAEDLRFPKRARKPPHNWVEQKKKKKEMRREKRKMKSGQDQHSREEDVKEERNLHPERPLN